MADSGEGGDGGDWEVVGKGKGKGKDRKGNQNQSKDGNNNNREGNYPSTSTSSRSGGGGSNSYGNGAQNQSRGGNYASSSRGGASSYSNPSRNQQQQQQQSSHHSNGANNNYRPYGGKTSVSFEAKETVVPSCVKKPSNSDGWKPLPDNKEDIKLPLSKGPGIYYSRDVVVATNHFRSPINLPDQILHYEILVVRKTSASSAARVSSSGDGDDNQKEKKDEKKLPAELRMGIIKRYIQELEEDLEAQNRPTKLISDFSNTFNTFVNLNNLLGSRIKKDINIRNIANYDPTMGDGIFEVTLEKTLGNFDTTELKPYMNNLRNLPEELEDDYSLTRMEQVYNTLLKNIGGDSYVPAGRSSMIKIPSEGQARNNIGKGLEALEGASIIYNMGWKPAVNIDLQHRPYYSNIKVSEYLEQNDFSKDEIFQKAENWTENGINLARGLLKDIKVVYNEGPNHQTKGGKIVDISKKGASTTFFDKKGQQISVAEHFQEQFEISLRHPKAICLKLNNGNVIVPLELCTIKKGQSFNKKLAAEQTSEIMHFSRNDPTQLKEKIDKEVKSLNLSGDETMRAFGANFDNNPIKFQKTRIIVPPKIVYGTNESNSNTVATITPTDGTWEPGNFDNLKFIQPALAKTWGLVYLSKSKWMQNMDKFEKDFVEMANQRGIVLGQKRFEKDEINIIKELGSSSENKARLVKIFQEAKNEGIEFLLVVIPRKGCRLYDQVKVAAEAAEHHVGLVTQCITKTTFESANRSKIANLLLKLNVKMGGINNLIGIPKDSSNQFDFNKVPCLFLGADVTHPPPDHNVKPGWTPSFAAVTANISHNGLPTAMKIQAQVKADKGAAEVINNFDTIVGEFLSIYNNNMGILPEKIIFYRDGVGNGQFNEVLNVEMRSIREACTKFTSSDGQNYQPKITFIVVQKRHKTRAYCERFVNGKYVYSNCQAGTVIDKEIVHRKEEDFYMFSHKGMLGTSRSTHYRVLWDDSEFTMDQIESMSYNLCYNYPRCNRAVRVPSPALFAHLAASRAKVLYGANKVPFPTDALCQTENAKIHYINAINEKLKIDPAFRREFPMHFI